MGLADDVLNDFEYDSENENQEHEQEHEQEHKQEYEQKQELEQEYEKEYKQDLDRDSEQETEEENKIDFKQIIILVATIVLSYVFIIQYKIFDFLLEVKFQNVPMHVKRIALCSVILSIVYGLLKLAL